jgi:signal transduction histidine kinase
MTRNEELKATMRFMGAPPHDSIEDAAAVLVRAATRARRVLAGPDGPLVLALVLSLVAMAEVTIYTDQVGTALIANLLATLPLAFVRRRLAWAAGTIVFGVLLAISDASGALTIAALLALLTVLYLFAASYRRRWSVLLAFPFLVNAIVPLSGDAPGFPGVLLLMLVVAAEALGDSRRQRGQAMAERDETRLAMVDSLHDQAAMGERARIARDLHDVVAHHVSAIAVQAETARLTTEGLPDEGRVHLEAIGQTARDALGEMRRLLGVLRADANGEPELAPQPGLARLNELVETARAAGSEVRLTLNGQVTPLPQGVDLCAYRILQEALTNARRHAPGADVDVEIGYGADELRLLVRDHGPGPGEAQLAGHGLLGMRERAIMVGGTLTIGPAEGGGFAVEAMLPVPVPAG